MQDLQLLHQMQKALVRLRLGFSQPAVYKEQAQAALNTLSPGRHALHTTRTTSRIAPRPFCLLPIEE